METSIQSNVFPLRLLEPFQVIPSTAALQLFQEDIGRNVEIFVLETFEPGRSGAEMVPSPPCFSSGKYF